MIPAKARSANKFFILFFCACIFLFVTELNPANANILKLNPLRGLFFLHNIRAYEKDSSRIISSSNSILWMVRIYGFILISSTETR